MGGATRSLNNRPEVYPQRMGRGSILKPAKLIKGALKFFEHSRSHINETERSS